MCCGVGHPLFFMVFSFADTACLLHTILQYYYPKWTCFEGPSKGQFLNYTDSDNIAAHITVGCKQTTCNLPVHWSKYLAGCIHYTFAGLHAQSTISKRTYIHTYSSNRTPMARIFKTVAEHTQHKLSGTRFMC